MPDEKLTAYRGGKALRRGWTTGSCAAAASQAAAVLLLTGIAPPEIHLHTPGGITFCLPVEDAHMSGNAAVCTVRKDAGDDPDITNGVRITASVRRIEKGVTIEGGAGVGRITRPGLAMPVGEAAINPGPRQQIADAVHRAAQQNGYGGGFSVTISVKDGEALAAQTYNGHLGIVGGISILGTSGIVEPMSERRSWTPSDWSWTACTRRDSALRSCARATTARISRGTRSALTSNAQSSAPTSSVRRSTMRRTAAIPRFCWSGTRASW